MTFIRLSRNLLSRWTTTPKATLSTSMGLRSENSTSEPEQTKGFEKSVNSVTLLGRVGIDPQLKGSDTNPVVVFSLATSIRYIPGGSNSGNDYVSKTDWHNIAVFKPGLRESVQRNVVKGNRLFVQGKILYGTVEDKSGINRHTTTIVAEEVIRFAQ